MCARRRSRRDDDDDDGNDMKRMMMMMKMKMLMKKKKNTTTTTKKKNKMIKKKKLMMMMEMAMLIMMMMEMTMMTMTRVDDDDYDNDDDDNDNDWPGFWAGNRRVRFTRYSLQWDRVSAYAGFSGFDSQLWATCITSSATQKFAQNELVLTSEVRIHNTIYEGVDGATQINQKPVCNVGLSWQSGFPARGVYVIDNTHRKPAKREAGHHRR